MNIGEVRESTNRYHSVDLVLSTAASLVNGDRQQDYGTIQKNFTDVAGMWSILLDHPVTPYQVASCMAALKLCRSIASPKLDTHVDLAGYAAIMEELSTHDQ